MVLQGAGGRAGLTNFGPWIRKLDLGAFSVSTGSATAKLKSRCVQLWFRVETRRCVLKRPHRQPEEPASHASAGKKSLVPFEA